MRNRLRARLIATAVIATLYFTGCQTAPRAPEVLELREFPTPTALAAWMGTNFRYDRDRLHATTAPWETTAKRTPFEPIDPDVFRRDPRGICTDLAHFGVEMLLRNRPELAPFYLRMRTPPVRVRGHRVSNHWVAGYREEGALFFR